MTTDLVFDFFGTLVQYQSSTFHTAPYTQTHAYLLQHNFALSYSAFTTAFTAASEELEEQAHRTGQEYHMDDLARKFFQIAFSLEVAEETNHTFGMTFLQEWERGITYFDDIAPFLTQLSTKYRLSLLSNTNYPPLIHRHLEEMGIRDRFAHVFTSIEIGTRKPHNSAFQHMLTTLESPAERVVYIGDSYLADYQGALNSGIRAILIDPEGKHLKVPTRTESLFAIEQHL